MKKHELERASVAELVDRYVEAAIAHGESSLKGKYKVTNKAYDVIAEVYRELRRRGLESQKALLKLLDHQDTSVRCWAAAHALEFEPKDGIAVLEQIVRSGGIIGLDAEMTLMEWRNGSLKFP